MNREGLVAAAYRDLLQQIDRWFAASSAAHPGIIPCRTGCSACCHGPFDISAADALLVREAVARLPAAEQDEIGRKSRRLAARMGQLEPDWNQSEGLGGIGEDGFDRISETLAQEPCPLLGQDGSCRIYDDRPLVCRLIGLGMITPAGRTIANACPIAGQFPGYATLPPQPFDLEALEELEQASLEAASVELFGTPDRSGYETTVALALTSPSPPR